MKNSFISPARTSREESRLQTKVLLREAALKEFALRGVAGTSAERIAQVAGYTRGAFYAHFPNKEALLLDLMETKMAAESPHWVRLADESTDTEQVLRDMGARAEQFDPHGLWALISIETYLCSLRDPAFAVRYQQYHDGVRSVCCLFLSRMFKRAGKLPAAPLEDLAEILLGLSMTSSLPRPADRDGRPVSSRSTEMLLVVLRGFLTSGQPEQAQVEFKTGRAG